MALGLDLESPLINASGTAMVQGEIIRVSGINRATKAKADLTANVFGLYGVVVAGSVANGGSVQAATASAKGLVLCDSGLTINPGDRLYVSAATAGRATNVAPANAFVIGVVTDPTQYARTGRVYAMYEAAGAFGTAGSGSPLSWWQGRQARAIFLLNANGVQVTNPIPIDFLHTPGDVSASVNAPTLVTTYSGGVYNYPGPGFGILYPFGPAAGPTTLVALPKTEPWYAATLIRVEAAAAGAGKVCFPLRLLNAGGHVIEVGWNATDSTTIAELLYSNGVLTTQPLGAVATLGAATCPVAAQFTIEMFYNAAAGTLNVGFQDVPAGSFSGLQLNNMPTDNLYLGVLSNDNTLLMKQFAMFAMIA